jgi:SAM-dependent methyltransferase
MSELFVCPLDRGPIADRRCVSCGTVFPVVTTESQRDVIDYRAVDHVTTRELPVRVPANRPDVIDLEAFGAAGRSSFQAPSRGELRRGYGTKLQREVLYYLHHARETFGAGARVLDLGCGNGGNKRYLLAQGFIDVIAVDYFPTTGAEALADAHRLPFEDASMDVVLSTATVEHFAQPFVAISEIARVLRPGGRFIGSVSFWESWHGRSCFHMTPDGIAVLCASADLALVDLWPGWGFIPALLAHGLGLPGFRRVTYALQRTFDRMYVLTRGESAARSHRFRTAGSFGLVAEAPARVIQS